MADGTPLISIHPEAQTRFDEQIKELAECLEVRPAQKMPHCYTPDAVVTVIDPEDIQKIRLSKTDASGRRTAIIFKHQGQEIVLDGEAHDNFVRFCETVQRGKTIKPYISLVTVEDTATEWIHQTYFEKETLGFTQFALPMWEKSIQPMDIVLPLGGLSVQTEFDLGRVTVGPLREAFFKSVQLPETGDDAGIIKGMEQIRTKLQGRGAAKIATRAEPKRAYEIAIEETERAMSMLAFFLHKCWCQVPRERRFGLER